MQHTLIIDAMTTTAGHELLDFGGGARLERFGDRVTDRPHPAALGARATPERWAAADLRFARERGWTGPTGHPETATAADAGSWLVEVEGITMELRPTDAGQVGLFPEHAAMLPWLRAQIQARTGASTSERAIAKPGERAGPKAGERAAAAADGPATPPHVLHLFGYTGLATLAMAAAGASVTHVDASRPAVAWARRNATQSGLADRPVRWVVDDALAFTEREIRRGRRYHGVVLDPPTYGHGPRTGAWRLDQDLASLLTACGRVLRDDGFVLLTAHTAGFGADRLRDELDDAIARRASATEAGDLHLVTPDGRRLELGAFARIPGGA